MRIVVIMIAVINTIIIIIIIITSIIGIFTMTHDCVTAGFHAVLKYEFTRLQVMPAHNVSQNRKKPVHKRTRVENAQECAGATPKIPLSSLRLLPCSSPIKQGMSRILGSC